MVPLPEWCSQNYLNRFVGGQVSIINRYIDASFHGDIGGIELNDETNHLTIAYNWFAVGADANNRCSLKGRKVWVETQDEINELDLWTILDGKRMMLYVGRPISDGRLIIDGGELMEAIFTFLPAGLMTVARSDVQAADPNNPVDRTVRYVTGNIPGGTRLPGGGSYAMYKADDDGDPRHVGLGDDGK